MPPIVPELSLVELDDPLPLQADTRHQPLLAEEASVDVGFQGRRRQGLRRA